MGDDEGEAKLAGGAANVACKMAGLGSHCTHRLTQRTQRRKKRIQAAQRGGREQRSNEEAIIGAAHVG